MNCSLLSWCLLLVALLRKVDIVVESVALVATLPSPPVWGYRSTILVRGGGDDEEEDDEEDEEDEVVESPNVENGDDLEVIEDDEDEEEAAVAPAREPVQLDAALAAAALKSASKAKVSQQASVKKVVNIQLQAKSKRRLFPRIPYILRATLNPWTLLAMTKSYWASLFNLDYLQTASGQELRSAVEEQAKRRPPAPSRFRKRTMKRGHAKTLNDLPKLSS
jgi:hypothetical protein